MDDTSPRSAAAAKVKRHRDGIATKLKRIEASLDDLREALDCLVAEYRRDQSQDVRR